MVEVSRHEGNVTVLTGVMVEVFRHEGNVTVLTGVMVEVSGHKGNVTGEHRVMNLLTILEHC